MTESSFDDGGTSTQLRMDQRQFAQLMTTMADALRQTTTPLSTDQQAVALQFRLLRNGLGHFESASEAFDRALIRIDEVHHGGRIELVFHDPIPRAARSMVLVIGSRRVQRPLPGPRKYGLYGHALGGDLGQLAVELVELLDQFEVPVAAGVPSLVQGRPGDDYTESVLEVIAQESATGSDDLAKTRLTPKPSRS